MKSSDAPVVPKNDNGEILAGVGETLADPRGGLTDGDIPTQALRNSEIMKRRVHPDVAADQDGEHDPFSELKVAKETK